MWVLYFMDDILADYNNNCMLSSCAHVLVFETHVQGLTFCQAEIDQLEAGAEKKKKALLKVGFRVGAVASPRLHSDSMTCMDTTDYFTYSRLPNHRAGRVGEPVCKHARQLRSVPVRHLRRSRDSRGPFSQGARVTPLDMRAYLDLSARLNARVHAFV